MYAIICTPEYYQTTHNAPQESFLTYRDLADNLNHPDATDDIAEWDTKEEAQSVIDDIQDYDVYYLAHGEAGAPSYDIIEDYDIGDDCRNASGVEIYEYFEIDPYDLPDGVESALDTLDVEYHSSGDDYDEYHAYVTINDIDYAIVFCPSTLALQINADDLSCLNWDHPAYFVKEGE